ncbi:hypothetical protein [Pelomonas sp. SE-A7]|uniref:hypothetical protein n=1 Tax=Pelomonas sp. SE-A7 TaxID=3054953 RepID=UPI00259C9382|nr:hypothetical protein [Pelomonas sp. SE-A7]MDM4765212.1 hypothetical protein [Pelomonas sp. SE-A7]
MMWLVIGIGNLLVGAAYSGLGLLSAWEAVSQYRTRGLSRFGLGFSMMAASCGPHHLAHGWCVLNGGTVSPSLLGITLLGLPAGLIFCLLRIEAALGGPGDRTVLARPTTMAALATVFLLLVGLLAGLAMMAPAPLVTQLICTARGFIQLPVEGPAAPGSSMASVILGSNLFVTVTYGMVGWYLVATQVRRYVLDRSWSLSGLSLAAVFPTCAAMHLVAALASNHEAITLPFDLLGVPASIYFLWVVHRLHSDSVIDWNRRPLVGIAATPHREAPWSDQPAAIR